MTFTRSQIEAIQPGTLIARSLDGQTWGQPRKVVSIFARRKDITGRLVVCGYTVFGDSAEMSFSIKEGDTDARFYRIIG